MFPAILGVLGPLIGKVIDNVLPDPKEAAAAKLQAMSLLSTEYTQELKSATSIIVAEAKSESWIASNWRPLTMLTFVSIVANNYIIHPWLVTFGLPSVVLDLPPDMWDLLKIGLGGYVVGRSAEKGIKLWKTKADSA